MDVQEAGKEHRETIVTCECEQARWRIAAPEWSAFTSCRFTLAWLGNTAKLELGRIEERMQTEATVELLDDGDTGDYVCPERGIADYMLVRQTKNNASHVLRRRAWKDMVSLTVFFFLTKVVGSTD